MSRCLICLKDWIDVDVQDNRARESQSTAEQELLSSTSPDVCELWSGEEVVRMIGSPAGMKTRVVTKSSEGEVEVLDLAGAFRGGLLQSPGLLIGDRNTVKILKELSDAAPNLALNVKNATSSSRKLWLWASVGLVLQAAAGDPGHGNLLLELGEGRCADCTIWIPMLSYRYPHGDHRGCGLWSRH